MKRIIRVEIIISLFLAIAPTIPAHGTPSEPGGSPNALSLPPAASPSPTDAEPSYEIADLGSLASVADDVTVSINASGQVSLWVQTPDQTVQAALWSKGTLNDLGTPSGYPNSISHGISDRGEIVGWANTSANSVDSLSTTRAFVCSRGHLSLLGTLGGRDSRAFAVNARGQIAGDSNLASGDRHGFLFDRGVLKDLGTLPGGRFSQAFSMNDKGDVAGVSDSSRPFKHAVLWRGSQISDLGLLPGGTTSSAQAINDHDDVAGYADTPDGTHAFLWTNGRMQDLGTLGSEPSNACGVNDAGEVVGGSNISPYQRHAFLWKNGRMIDLNRLVAPDWVLSRASGINDRGQIVCLGHEKGSPSVPSHVLLLTPLAGFHQRAKP